MQYQVICLIIIALVCGFVNINYPCELEGNLEMRGVV